MKKICNVLLIIMALFTCVVFSACKDDKYKKLQMAFISTDGNPLGSVELLIDNSVEDGSENDNSNIDLCVKFLNIANKYVGEVAVATSPIELATISNLTVSKGMCSFNVDANMSGSGEIVVTHKSTGKTAKLDLNIGQKSSGLVLKQSEYMVSKAEQVHTIDANLLVSLLPNGSTDEVLFKLESTVTGITPVYEVEDLFKHINISSSVQNGSSISVVPATRTTLTNEIKYYPDQQITIYFVQEVDDFVINSSSYYDLSTSGTASNPIHLISNDLSLYNNEHRFNSMPVSISAQTSEMERSLMFYNLVPESEDYNISAELTSYTSAVVVAHGYTNSTVPIKLKLVPKFEGSVKEISKTVYVKGEEKPTGVNIYKQNMLIESGETVDIYNYYAGSSNTLGTMFNFVPVENYSFVELQNIQLVLEPSILNAYYLSNSDGVGINPVFKDETFSEQITTQAIDSVGDVDILTRNESQVLEIYKYNQPLKFYYNKTTGKLVSEKVLPTDNIYIKYAEISDLKDEDGGEANTKLKVTIQTFYSGTEKYLNKISCVSEELRFTGVYGVKSIKVGGGYILSNGGNSYTQERYQNEQEQNIELSEIYVDCTDNSKAYLLHIFDVKDIDGIISESQFTVSVTAGTANPLKIVQYGSVYQNGLVEQVKTDAVSVIEKYNYRENDLTNSILLVFDENTSVGVYTITIEHKSNERPLKQIKCTVYKKATEQDFSLYFNQDKFNFSNKTEQGELIYKDYKADYIVAKNSTISLEIDLGTVFLQTNMLKSYIHSAEIITFDEETQTYISEEMVNLEEFIDISRENNKITVSFKKATLDTTDEENKFNKYIKIYFGASFINYQNLTDQIEDHTPTNYATFFVYEKVEIDNIEIRGTVNDKELKDLTLYYSDTVGYYYLNQTTENLYVQFKTNNEHLWDYVELNEQSNKVLWYDEDNAWLSQKNVAPASVNDDLSIQFMSGGESAISTFNLFAEIKQFGQVYTKVCVVTVKPSVLTDRLVVTSEISKDIYDNLYLDLELGAEYEVTANHFSSSGQQVSFKDIELVVVDSNYAVNSMTAFATKTEDGKHIVKVKNNASATNELKLIIISKDILKKEIKNNSYGFDNMNSNWLVTSSVPNQYKNAYIIVDLFITDGTKENPYIINESKDFLDIAENNAKLSKYFVVMNDIKLTETKTIENFSGQIKAYYSDQYVTISGISLNNTTKNLFKEIRTIDLGEANLVGILFEVNYAYNNASGNLGLIGVNNGLLTNVGAKISGLASFSATTTFGGLVAVNNGTIKYEQSSNVKLNGISGNITLKQSSDYITFGGLVGKNISAIQGSFTGNIASSSETAEEKEQKNGKDIVLVATFGADGAIANLTVNSELATQNTTIGLVCGENAENGKISNAHVKGEIVHKGFGNIGGVVGVNSAVSSGNMVKVNLSSNNVSNIITTLDGNITFSTIKSSVDIILKNGVSAQATNYVGGIVGSDAGGYYNNCHYQVLSDSQGIQGGGYVGGIAGKSQDGTFEFCSVMSYKWNYNNLQSTKEENSVSDVYGTVVGGFIGFAQSSKSITNGVATDRVVILESSSVNAYLEAEQQIYGMIGHTTSTATIHNAYVLGRIKNISTSSNEDIYDGLFANSETLWYMVYGKTASHGDYILEQYPSSTWSAQSPWQQNNEINGGYYFISNDGTFPIYEIAPTKITAKAKIQQDELNSNVNLNDNIIHLDYYDFMLDTTASDYVDVFNKLNNKFNTYLITDLFDITYIPESLRNVQVNVESSRPSVVSVTQGNKLVVKGVGECVLTFSSVINPSIKHKITVVVDYPIGEEIVISEYSEDNSGAVSSVQIAKGKAKIFYLVSTGYKQLNVGEMYPKYSYKTNTNIELDIEISVDKTVTISDFISISGAEKVAESQTYHLSPNTPFVITVLDNLEGGTFTFTITPYITFKGTDEYGNDYGYKISTTTPNVTLQTKEGPTSVALGHTDAIVYPNDITYLTAYISTDIEVKNDTLLKFIKDIQDGKLKVDEGKNVTISVVSSNFEQNKNLQTVKYALNFEDLEGIDTKYYLETELQVGGITATANYVILPQRINKIDVTNYVYENSTIVQNNTLKQEGSGLMIIDMAPYNGYFDYLEIIDLSNEEHLISFQQVLDETQKIPTDKQDEATENGLGIILRKLNFNLIDNTSIFVKTTIDIQALSSVHKVKVIAYCYDENNNRIKLQEADIFIDVQMLPSIEVEYLSPSNDVVGKTKTDGDPLSGMAKYVAKDTQTKFRVTTKNATEELKIVSVTQGATFTKDTFLTNIYILDVTGLAVGNTVTIKLKAISTYANNKTEERDIELTFTIVNFVVYGVTVSPATETSPDVIYGNLDVDVPIVYSFEYGDIAYNGIADKNEDITAILDALNKGDYNKLLEKTQTGYKALGNTNIAELKNGNKLRVKDLDHQKIKLCLDFALQLDSGVWKVCSLGTENCVQTTNYYSLKFTERMSALNMEVIKDEEDFKNMASGEAYYILGNDITLRNYTPIDVQVKQFDGNGRTITIESFAKSTEADAKYGLFKQIPQGMTVMNVVVEYKLGSFIGKEQDISVTRYEDLATNETVSYTSVNFGGITAQNFGVVTNCVVKGDIVVEATQLEAKVNASGNSNFDIPFYFGGIVAENSSTGYITHSTMQAKVVALANIGGVVHTNNGKIASSGINANTNKGLIYAYKTGLTTSITVQVGGFVVQNYGSILMSYAEFGTTTLNSGNTIGNLSSKNVLAGFVYTNSGTIQESYITLAKLGQNQNRFTGFVQTNLGKIAICYSYINMGVKTNSTTMFTPTNSGTFENCVIIQNYNAEPTNIPGISTTYTNVIQGKEYYYMYNKTFFADRGFVFGNTKQGAVFVMSSSSIPKLVSTQDSVEYTEGKAPTKTTITDSNGVEKTITTYYGLRNYEIIAQNVYDSKTGQNIIQETKQTIELNHGSKNNPYVIDSVEMWNLYFDSTTSDYSTAYYYRLVADLDFSLIYADLITSNQTFYGNLQGNGMTISGIRIYSNQELSSVGLFKELVGGKYKSVTNTISNLNLSAISINATKTKVVGVLAGITENFNLYNIHLSSNNLIVVGGNAVGGIAGLVRGSFDIDCVSSNVGVTSIREVTSGTYSIYNSYANGKSKSENLTSVYYAGSVFGILDGYKSESAVTGNRDVNSANYLFAQNINVFGTTSSVGETVGGAIGLVGENVKLTNVSVKIAGDFNGSQYSGGIVGENRGIISYATFETTNSTSFARSKYVSGGIVGLNLGGLVQNCSSSATIINTLTGATAGGLVGRNVGGYLISSTFNGKVYAYYTGGILGSDYSFEMLKKATYGSGALTSSSKDAIPTSETYSGVVNLTNLVVGKQTLEHWISLLSDFYNHEISLEGQIVTEAEAKVLGMFIGLTNKSLADYFVNETEIITVKVNGEDQQQEIKYIDMFLTEHGLEINSSTALTAENIKNVVESSEITVSINDDSTIKEIYNVQSDLVSADTILYIVGVDQIGQIDAWNRSSYCEDSMVVLKMKTQTE